MKDWFLLLTKQKIVFIFWQIIQHKNLLQVFQTVFTRHCILNQIHTVAILGIPSKIDTGEWIIRYIECYKCNTHVTPQHMCKSFNLKWSKLLKYFDAVATVVPTQLQLLFLLLYYIILYTVTLFRRFYLKRAVENVISMYSIILIIFDLTDIPIFSLICHYHKQTWISKFNLLVTLIIRMLL